jgi:hypothetical protein
MKVKLSLHVIRRIRGVEVYLRSFLNLAIEGGEGSLYQWAETHRCQLNWGGGVLPGPPRRSGRFGEEQNVWSLPGIEPGLLRRPTHSQVTILTELPQLLVKSTTKTTSNLCTKRQSQCQAAAECPVTSVSVQHDRPTDRTTALHVTGQSCCCRCWLIALYRPREGR